MSTISDLKTIAFIASYLGVTDRSVRNYISQGLFPGYRIPGTRGVRIRLSEVQRAMKTIPAARVRNNATLFGPKARIYDLPPQPVRVEAVEEGE
ncbi:helix-turn-helix transcriptional regulator [Humibacter sp.]|uniref:helix-turn-helix transcriptional regulator n=1 Tax=Humibacter sp. TaxID=1940291 RepID=UPI003F7DCC96